MYIRTRDESIEQLSETLNPEQLRKAITQQYSALSLSVIADFKKEYARQLIDSSYSANTINKLTEAYVNNKIDSDDLFRAVKYTEHSNRNELYVDDFLDSIDKGFYHETAAKTFSAVLFEKCSYREAMDFVKSGAFYPTEYASLSVRNDVAGQLDEMGVSLRGCEGFNYCYDIANLKETIKSGDAVFIPDKNLAVQVKEMMQLPDWENFCCEVRYIMGQDIDKLTWNKLADLRDDYVREKFGKQLYDKVKSEYNTFITDMKKEPAETIIQSAYEIVSKDNIVMYCEEHTPGLSEKQFAALMSCKNTLDEVYEQWCQNSEWHSLEDIGLALEETADSIKISIDRSFSEQKAEAAPEQKTAVKPKNKSR